MEDIRRQIEFGFNGAKYLIEFPTVRQLTLIETNKTSLTKGMYKDMVMTGTVGTEAVLDFVDMVSTLSILCPKFVEDLKVDTLMDLDALDARKLFKAYDEQVAPWIADWMVLFKKPTEKLADHDEKAQGDGHEGHKSD